MGGNSIDLPLDLPDAELVSYLRSGSTLTVEVRTWDERTIRLVFEDVVGVHGLGLSQITALVSGPQDHLLVEEALNHLYERRPGCHPYQAYSFLDLDSKPVLSVVAVGVTA